MFTATSTEGRPLHLGAISVITEIFNNGTIEARFTPGDKPVLQDVLTQVFKSYVLFREKSKNKLNWKTQEQLKNFGCLDVLALWGVGHTVEKVKENLGCVLGCSSPGSDRKFSLCVDFVALEVIKM